MNSIYSLEVIFFAALEKGSPAERTAYLDEACTADPDLRCRVEKMLAPQALATSFLEQPAPGVCARIDAPSAEKPGAMIGPYKLLEQIGEGGMGLVYVAEQQHPVKRRVALKLIKPGMDSRQVIARFEAERQALAIMDHPNIAKIHDGGTTSGESGTVGAGRPYFVMELVKGKPITEFADLHRLTTRQRLELFLDLCHAVQHAHLKGIIHRDLKPSNVLVSLHGVRPVVKIIDFGVAKAIGERLTDQSIYTCFTQMIGTPLYMSPEQAGLSDLDVDTRSDVYSLGVLLYELLTGTTPFDSVELKKANYDEMRRIIREDEPPRPSTRLTTMEQAALSTICEHRSAEPRKLNQQVRGDLDWIVMKALEKDRDRRYESASAFAADVQRYLGEDAVEACPPSAGYRLLKYMRRNRRILVPAAIVAVALATATAVSMWQAVRANDAQHQAEADRQQAEADRDRAKTAERDAKADQDRAKTAEQHAATEAAIARAVNDFLQEDLLEQAASAPPDREFDGDPYLTVKEALDRAAARIGTRFQDQPLAEAAIRMAIARGYNGLLQHQLAVPHVKRALELRQAHLGLDHPDTLSSLSSLAAEYCWVCRYAEATTLYQQILENRKARFGPDHPETLSAMRDLAGVYSNDKQCEKSLQLLKQVLEKFQTNTNYGPTHPETLGTMHYLACNYELLGRFSDSMALHERLLDGIKARSGAEYESAIWPRMTFGRVCQRAGKLERAEQLLREVLESLRTKETSFSCRRQTADTLGWLALNMYLKQKYNAAEPLLKETLAFYEKERPDAKRTFYWRNLLGAVLLGQQRYAEAEPLILQGYEGIKRREATYQDSPFLLPEAGERVVRFYEATNQPEKALAWREKLKTGEPGGASTSAK